MGNRNIWIITWIVLIISMMDKRKLLELVKESLAEARAMGEDESLGFLFMICDEKDDKIHTTICCSENHFMNMITSLAMKDPNIIDSIMEALLPLMPQSVSFNTEGLSHEEIAKEIILQLKQKEPRPGEEPFHFDR